MELMNISEGTCCTSEKQAVAPSLLDNLRRRQIDASSRLADLNAAIAALEANPEVAKVLELVARAR